MEDDIEIPFKTKEEFKKYIEDVPETPSLSWEESLDYMEENSMAEKIIRGELETELTFTEKNLQRLHEGDFVRSQIPGMRGRFCIPNTSSILPSEMQQLFPIALKIGREENLNEKDLRYWNELSEKVTEEQEIYMQYCRTQWQRNGALKHSEISPEILEYVNTCWKLKLEGVSSLPLGYATLMVIPLHTDGFKERCELTFKSTIKQIGRNPLKYSFPFLKENPLNAKSVLAKLKSDIDLLEKKDDDWPKYKRRFDKMGSKYHPDISKDEEAKILASEHGVQVVCSSSAFSALIIISGMESSWDIPFVVKEVDSDKGKKKVVFLDKKLPPRSMNTVDRQKFYMKKAIKKLFLRSNSNRSGELSKSCLSCSKLNSMSEKVVNSNDDYEKLLDDDEESVDDPTVETEVLCLNNDEEKEVMDEIKASDDDDDDEEDDDEEKLVIDDSEEKQKNSNRELIESVIHDMLTNSTPKCTCNRKISFPKEKGLNYLVEYNLWDLKSKDDNNVLLKKSKPKDLKLIIRTTHEGRGHLNRETILNTKLSAKLEYQPEYGAETLTLNESLKDWASVLIRKDAYLTRVRVDPLTGEVIQLERKNLLSLTKECQHLHEINPYDLITHVHIVLDKLASLSPGNYLLNHEPGCHQCVTVYRESDRNSLDLQMRYGSVNTADKGHPNAEFLQIDTNIVTPVFYFMRRVPCCFAPARSENRKNSLIKKPTPPPKRRMAKKRKNSGLELG